MNVLKSVQRPLGFNYARHCKSIEIQTVLNFAKESGNKYLLHGLIDNCCKKFIIYQTENFISDAIAMIEILVNEKHFPRYLQNLAGPKRFRSEIVKLLCKNPMKSTSWTENLYEKSVYLTMQKLNQTPDSELRKSKHYYNVYKDHGRNLKLVKEYLARDFVFDVNYYYRYYVSCIPTGHFKDVITFYHNHTQEYYIQMEFLAIPLNVFRTLDSLSTNLQLNQMTENEIAFHILSWSTIMASIANRLYYRQNPIYVECLFVCFDTIIKLISSSRTLHVSTYLHAIGYFYAIERVQYLSPNLIKCLDGLQLKRNGLDIHTIYEKFQEYYSSLQGNISKLSDMKTRSMTQRYIDLQFDALDYNYKLVSFKIGFSNATTDSIIQICKESTEKEIRYFIRCIVGHAKRSDNSNIIKERIKAIIANEILDYRAAWYYTLNQLSIYPAKGEALKLIFEYIVNTYPEDELMIGTATFLYLKGLTKLDPDIVKNWLNEFINEVPFSRKRLLRLVNLLYNHGFKTKNERQLFLSNLPQNMQDSVEIFSKPSISEKKLRRRTKV
eukprot:NODE_538_length_6306_cov_1.301273.p2 type:complete len:553 gc:universal NODE_538_length_6306_cov_1.301273:5617-3959(-)